VRAAEDIEDYRASRVGAYLEVPLGMVFCARESLWGFALWGRPGVDDVRRIPLLIDDELGPGVAPHASLCDLRYLEEADAGSFSPLIKYLTSNAEAIGSRLTRVAVVRPGGVLGMIVAGFHDVIGSRYPVQVFEDFQAAAAWVDGAEIADELDAAIGEASQRFAALVRLRRWLDDNIACASLDRAARAIARAPRSLQRDLESARSSFRRELEAARVRRAKRLLAGTDDSLTRIAYEIGCASPQHFSALFRRLSGVSPSAWRTLRRAGVHSSLDPRQGPAARRPRSTRARSSSIR